MASRAPDSAPIDSAPTRDVRNAHSARFQLGDGIAERRKPAESEFGNRARRPPVAVDHLALSVARAILHPRLTKLLPMTLVVCADFILRNFVRRSHFASHVVDGRVSYDVIDRAWTRASR